MVLPKHLLPEPSRPLKFALPRLLPQTASLRGVPSRSPQAGVTAASKGQEWRVLLTYGVQGENYPSQAKSFKEPECAEHRHVHRERHGQAKDQNEDDGEQ